MATALDTWAINHKRIHFEDVSEACWEEWEAAGRQGAACGNAELFLTTDRLHEGGLFEERYAAIVQRGRAGHMPTVLTSGTTLQQRNGIGRSEVVLNSQLCWYLDAAFCHRFHASDGGEWSELTTMHVVVVSVCSLSSIVLGCLCCLCLLPICTATASRRDDEPLSRPPVGSTRCDAALRAFARLPLISLLVAIYCLAAAPVFYVFVFLPCWDCYDFTATVAHEAGHILGFDHPDEFPRLNLRAKAGVHLGAPETCHRPLTPANIELEAPLKGAAGSIMLSMTQHRARTCLSEDDLQGLNFLYPSCDDPLGRGNALQAPRPIPLPLLSTPVTSFPRLT